MSHLGRWLSALIDGELDGSERDRVLNHLARCQPCRQEANALRALKRRMTALGDNSADSAVTGRLIELARSDADPVGRARSTWATPWPPPSASLPAWGRHQLRSGWLMAAGSAGMALTAIGAVAFLLGGGPATPAPKVTPAVETYWLQHGYDTGQAPAAPPGSAGTSSAAAGSSAQPGSYGGSSAAAGSASSPAGTPGSAGSTAAPPRWASSPASRPGPAGGPSPPSAAFRSSP
jgi:hypothetical protein